jgi:NosR/NirI family transcriptional regulator, nitrous oxide reductase regulator
MNLFRPLERLGLSPWGSLATRPRIDDRTHESNVRGIYVVGDLTEAPIIKMALKQGHEVGTHIARELGTPTDATDVLDAVIIGAGPSGVTAAEALRARGMRVAVFEKARPFATIHAFPKGKPIFAEPEGMENPSDLWFEDAPKDELAQRWCEHLRDGDLPLHTPEAVKTVRREGDGFVIETEVGADGRDGDRPLADVPSDGAPGARNTYRARRIVVAVGKRGSVRKLGIPGEDLDKVRHHLDDPASYAGRRVLVVGGGDSAVEAAIATAEAGAEVVLSYRRDELTRPKARNQERFRELCEAGRIRFEGGTTPSRVTADAVCLEKGGETLELPNDDVLVFIGAGLPEDFLRGMGIQLEGDFRWLKFAWVVAFGLLVYGYYVMKRKMDLWPFGEGDPLGSLPELVKVDLGFRSVDGGFWGTLIYTGFILGFGIWLFLGKYRDSAEQRRKLVSLMLFQGLFLFGIPELVLPGIHAVAGALDALTGSFLHSFTSQPWMAYSFGVPWPLSLYSVVDGPTWVNTPEGAPSWHGFWAATLWTGLGLVTAFVFIPLYVWRHNLKFCSYLCGCGGLAETFGDAWRHLAPRGAGSHLLEWGGAVVFFLAIPTTLLLVNDAWQFIQSPFLTDAKAFSSGWYSLMVDFGLASLVGVAMYPVLGNRVWCRFACPLRAYMQVMAAGVGRLAIHSDDRCISCGQCTRYCQMGIEVQRFAEAQESFHNANSHCIQCGICVEVCPMDVLVLGRRGASAEDPWGRREVRVDLSGSGRPAMGALRSGPQAEIPPLADLFGLEAAPPEGR